MSNKLVGSWSKENNLYFREETGSCFSKSELAKHSSNPKYEMKTYQGGANLIPSLAAKIASPEGVAEIKRLLAMTPEQRSGQTEAAAEKREGREVADAIKTAKDIIGLLNKGLYHGGKAAAAESLATLASNCPEAADAISALVA